MNIFNLEIIDSFKENLLNAKTISIIGHKNIDADCLGASLAVATFFKKRNCEVKIIIPDKIPDFFCWLNLEDVIIYNQSKDKVADYLSLSEVIFMLDFGSLKRIDKLAVPVEKSNALKINIDHHREPENIADYSFVDINSSSASELVYEFLKIIDDNNIDKQIAEFIFLGIVSDTGSFKYDSANSKTFSIAAELMNYNIDKNKIISGLFNNFSFDRLKLLGNSILNRIKYFPEKSMAYMYLTKQDKKDFNYKTGDHENFVNYPLSIDGVEFSVLFFDDFDGVKISLRSVDQFDVNKVARKYFNGGGHINASGGRSSLNLEQTIDFFEKNIDQIILTAKS